MSELIELKGKLHLKSTEDGGRRGFILSGYRPLFEIEGKLFSGMILLEKQEKAYPGETVDATVYFIPGKLEFKFSLGTDLSFSEGPKPLGDFLITQANGIVDWDSGILRKIELDYYLSEMIKIMTSEDSINNSKVSQLIDEAVKHEYFNKSEVEAVLHI